MIQSQPKNLGIRVDLRLRLENFGIPPKTIEPRVVLRNVTEIHWNYPLIPGSKTDSKGSGRVAFESDIHIAGQTYDIGEVVEFETKPETEIAEHF